jgi:hypothetical protein
MITNKCLPGRPSIVEGVTAPITVLLSEELEP